MESIIHIFDVEHGACNVIETPMKDLIMIDCGHNSSRNWRPSDWVLKKELPITELILTNIDEDHLSDFPNIIDKCTVLSIRRNNNLSPEWIEKEKQKNGGLGIGVKKTIEYMKKLGPTSSKVKYPMEMKSYVHALGLFNDFNNLSLVTFINMGPVRIVFPGDLEKEGWEKFLINDNFIKYLKKTNIFIASHHGRKSGYCENVFRYCNPDIVVMSDKGVIYDTQEHDLYKKHVKGIIVNGECRWKLTTRCDGKIEIQINENGYTIKTYTL